MTIGTHTLRKTGFLFAVFGTLTSYNMTGRRAPSSAPTIQPMDDSAICDAARHQHSTNPQAYYQDSMTRFVEYSMDTPLAAENRVSPWLPNFVRMDTIRKTQSVERQYKGTVAELADDYVKKELGIDVNNVKNATFEQLTRLALRTNLDSRTSEEKFRDISKDITEENRDWKLPQMWALIKAECEGYRMHFAGVMAGALAGSNDAGYVHGGKCWWLRSLCRIRPFLTPYFAPCSASTETENSSSVDLAEAASMPPKKKRKYGTVNYDDKKRLLIAAKGDRQKTFELGLEFSKLNTGAGPDAADSKSASWVSKLKSAVTKWNKCIDGECWKDRGGKTGFLAMEGHLAYANYVCRCVKK